MIKYDEMTLSIVQTYFKDMNGGVNPPVLEKATWPVVKRFMIFHDPIPLTATSYTPKLLALILKKPAFAGKVPLKSPFGFPISH